MKKPDFFIVGAPKCGTTALYEYLIEHPEIYMPQGKEFHFFGSDLQRTREVSLEEYLSRFSEYRDEKRIGDSAVFYLYSKKAAGEIKAFSPDARIIVMIRNPVDMMYSLYYQFLWTGHENLRSFGDALNAEEERKKGYNIPKLKEQGVILPIIYRDIAKFSEQINRYFNVFGREKVHVIIFDDLKNDPDAEYKKTLRFLEVNDRYKADFKIINPNKVIRSFALLQFLRFPPPWLQTAWRALLPDTFRSKVLRKLFQTNTIYESRPPIEPEIRLLLQDELAAEIEKLSRLLGRDFTHWINEDNTI